MDVHYLTNAVGESTSSASMWDIVNQLGKHNFLMVRLFLLVGTFFDHMNRDALSLL